MCDLMPYDSDYVPVGHGFANQGNTCYFNSLLQCLLSCPSIFKTLELHKDASHNKNVPLIQSLMQLSKSALAKEDISQQCIPIWRDIIRLSSIRRDNVKLDLHSQHDAHEGLMMLLDYISDYNPELKRLFEYKQKNMILCDACGQWISIRSECNLVFEIQPELKTEQARQFSRIDPTYNKSRDLNNFLQLQNGYVEDFTCSNAECPKRCHCGENNASVPKCKNEKCDAKFVKFRVTKLTMVPEILAIVIKKYDQKILTDYPEELYFNTPNGYKLQYKLVAKSEHAGSRHGGHYWAECLRRSDATAINANTTADPNTTNLVWKNLNDNHVSDGTAKPTTNTYMIFYHFYQTIKE